MVTRRTLNSFARTAPYRMQTRLAHTDSSSRYRGLTVAKWSDYRSPNADAATGGHYSETGKKFTL